MKEHRVYSPIVNKNGEMVGLSPEQYVMEYSELSTAEETKKLAGVELMWCWYYGSKESPFASYPHNERCRAVTELVFDNIFKNREYDKKKIAYLRRGNILNEYTHAIDFFSRTDVNARATAKGLIEKMFDQYTDIIDKGAEGFKNKDGDVDYQKYASTMKLIRNELDEIIKKKEYGFAITEKFVNEDDDLTEGSYYISTYLKSK
jgi:hypothetical protein